MRFGLLAVVLLSSCALSHTVDDGRDAGGACGIFCISPPPGCSFVGADRCSCGTLVCEDAGCGPSPLPPCRTP